MLGMLGMYHLLQKQEISETTCQVSPFKHQTVKRIVHLLRNTPVTLTKASQGCHKLINE
jgi:hypothetical protein